MGAAGRPEPRGHDAGGLVPVEEHLREILSRIEPLPPREVALGDAGGCVLASDVVAERDLPPFASSAMDGFAVRAEDVEGADGASPVPLRIAGEALMGRALDVEVTPGAAVKIATGAPVPPGADCIVPIEDCVVEGERVLVVAAPGVGRHVRPAGEDARAGDVLLRGGRRLAPPDVGLAASAGRATVPVHPRPRVAILSTGEELVEPGRPLGPGQIHDANAFTLLGAVREAGAVPRPAGIVPDDQRSVRDALTEVLPEVDAVVTTGGISMGERDPVKLAFEGRGDIAFSRVAMQPGMPQAFGALEGKPFFGLPGNPVSVFVSFELFVRPALLRMMRRARLHRPEATAVLEEELRGLPAKTRYARVRVRRGDGGLVATPTGSHQSNLLSLVSRANALAVIPAGTEVLRAGEPCRVLVFRELGN